jgi:hypothetical protein
MIRCEDALRVVEENDDYGRVELSFGSARRKQAAELNARIFAQRSEEVEGSTYICQFTISNATPAQCFTFSQSSKSFLNTGVDVRAKVEDHTTWSSTLLEVKSPHHAILKVDPKHLSNVDRLVAGREFVSNMTWRKLKRSTDKKMVFVSAARTIDDTVKYPVTPGNIRASLAIGIIFEPDDAGEGGTRVTIHSTCNGKGRVPVNFTNHVQARIMQTRLSEYYRNFVEHKNPDGGDNGGVFPSAKSLYEYVPP